MEPFIRLRLLGSQLQNNEIQHFVQEIIHIHGFDKILSFIFNYFLHEYNQTKQYNNDLLNITNTISTIIHERENVNSSDKDLNIAKIIPISINNFPSDLIGECSSYLCLNDYINFMKTNRIIYCASNSPLTLQKLDIRSFYEPLDLTRFSMVKSLWICPIIYNKCKITQFTHLNELYLSGATENDIKMFINSDKINFSEITHLKLEEFANDIDDDIDDEHYDFDAFCYFLTQFPNVTHLELKEIFLTEFNSNNSNIPKITPKLQVLNCFHLGGNISANALRNQLMNMYSKQITELYVDEDDGDINTYSFVNLKNLGVYGPKNDSLEKIINSATDLKILRLEQCECKEITMDIIIKSFQKFTNMENISFRCHSIDIQNIVSYIEMGLINSKETNRKSLKVSIEIYFENIKMREIELYITRIMNALDLSNINDIMLQFSVPKDSDPNNYMNKIVEHFKKTHSMAHKKTEQIRIIISNKNCKINGYDITTFLNHFL